MVVSRDLKASEESSYPRKGGRFLYMNNLCRLHKLDLDAVYIESIAPWYDSVPTWLGCLDVDVARLLIHRARRYIPKLASQGSENML